MELVGRYSNPDEWVHLSDVTLALACSACDTFVDQLEHRLPPDRRPWPVVKRLGEQAIHDLLDDRNSGTKQSDLAVRYRIILSTVKRLLRHYSR